MIRSITFEGNDLFSTESLKTLMSLKEGDVLSEARLDADMALLARYFERARVVQRDAPDGVALVFEVEENPLIVDLKVHGAAEVSEGDVRKLLRTTVGQPLFLHLLAADAAALVAEYKRKGYAFVQVPEPAVTTPPGGGRIVTFTIVEGPQVAVERIVLRGNQSIPRGELLEIMQTKVKGPLDIFSSDYYREDALREDVVALARFYRNEGFLDAEVAIEDVRASDDKERVQVTLSIQEHQPYAVGDVKLVVQRPDDGHEGSMTPEDRAFLTDERIKEWLRIVPGQRWDGNMAEWARDRVREELFRRSYLDARVGEPTLRGREHEAVVDVEQTVRLGWKYRLRRIDFVGNEFTRDSFLRHEVRVTPGSWADRNELERGAARLRRTRYFQRVGMELLDVPGPDGEPGAWKDARYEIVEDKTGRLTFSLGLNTSGGFFGSVGFNKRNFDIARWPRSWDDLTSGRAFTGNGQSFDVFVAPGTDTTSYGVGFGEPNLFGSEWALSLRGYRRLEFRDDHDNDRLGYVVGLVRPLYRRSDDTLILSAGLRWRQEQIKVEDLDSDAIPGVRLFEGYNQVHALRLHASLRASDDVRRANRTLDANAGVELLGTALGGDIDVLKADASVNGSLTLGVDDEGRRRRLFLRGQMAWAEALEDTPEVPPFERFFAGGNDWRGFARRGVGPHINGNPTGGEWMLMGSVEYEHPLIGDTIKGVVFSDFGTLGTALGEPDAWGLRLTVGLGLRIKIPMFGEAPLALDFGWVLEDEDEDEREVFAFSLGKDF